MLCPKKKKKKKYFDFTLFGTLKVHKCLAEADF